MANPNFMRSQWQRDMYEWVNSPDYPKISFDNFCKRKYTPQKSQETKTMGIAGIIKLSYELFPDGEGE
jgi:hypothetical protein